LKGTAFFVVEAIKMFLNGKNLITASSFR